LQYGVRRLFPKLNVNVSPIDFNNALRVSAFRARVVDCFGLMLNFGIHHAIDAPLNADPKVVGAKLLRAAYPRGWAVP
jgi:hypothetical protein